MSGRSEVLALVKRYGRTTISFQSLNPGLQYWFDGDACVAYVESGGAWIAAGAPIAPAERELEVMEKFVQAARSKRKRARFFGVESDISAQSSFDVLHLGEQPVWDPQTWPHGLKKKLRDQMRRARANAVVDVRLATQAEIDDPTSATRRGLDAVISHWFDSRKMAPMGFLVQIEPYGLAHERRFIVAERQGTVVGAMIAIPICERRGWFLDNMLRQPTAPNGTVELMFDFALRTFAEEGCPYVSFGVSPLAGTPSRALQWLRRSTRFLYNFDGLRAFKAKLGPTSWHPVYLAYPKGERGWSAVIDMMRAFLPGGFLVFLWNTLLQRASLVAGIMAGIMLPWTLAIALADPARWFPSPAIRGAWVAFDVFMLVALLVLARKWRRSLAVALSGLSMLDFALSCAQFALYNLEHRRGADWPVSAFAILAPLLTSIFLWAARNRAATRHSSLSPEGRSA